MRRKGAYHPRVTRNHGAFAAPTPPGGSHPARSCSTLTLVSRVSLVLLSLLLPSQADGSGGAVGAGMETVASQVAAVDDFSESASLAPAASKADGAAAAAAAGGARKRGRGRLGTSSKAATEAYKVSNAAHQVNGEHSTLTYGESDTNQALAVELLQAPSTAAGAAAAGAGEAFTPIRVVADANSRRRQYLWEPSSNDGDIAIRNKAARHVTLTFAVVETEVDGKATLGFRCEDQHDVGGGVENAMHGVRTDKTNVDVLFTEIGKGESVRRMGSAEGMGRFGVGNTVTTAQSKRVDVVSTARSRDGKGPITRVRYGFRTVGFDTIAEDGGDRLDIEVLPHSEPETMDDGTPCGLAVEFVPFYAERMGIEDASPAALLANPEFVSMVNVWVGDIVSMLINVRAARPDLESLTATFTLPDGRSVDLCAIADNMDAFVLATHMRDERDRRLRVIDGALAEVRESRKTADLTQVESLDGKVAHLEAERKTVESVDLLDMSALAEANLISNSGKVMPSGAPICETTVPVVVSPSGHWKHALKRGKLATLHLTVFHAQHPLRLTFANGLMMTDAANDAATRTVRGLLCKGIAAELEHGVRRKGKAAVATLKQFTASDVSSGSLERYVGATVSKLSWVARLSGPFVPYRSQDKSAVAAHVFVVDAPSRSACGDPFEVTRSGHATDVLRVLTEVGKCAPPPPADADGLAVDPSQVAPLLGLARAMASTRVEKTIKHMTDTVAANRSELLADVAERAAVDSERTQRFGDNFQEAARVYPPRTLTDMTVAEALDPLKDTQAVVYFLVEGDSAVTALKEWMRALPPNVRERVGYILLTGKILNVQGQPMERILRDPAVAMIVAAVGMTTYGDCVATNLVAMTDGDGHGGHIATEIGAVVQRLMPQPMRDNPCFLSTCVSPYAVMDLSTTAAGGGAVPPVPIYSNTMVQHLRPLLTKGTAIAALADADVPDDTDVEPDSDDEVTRETINRSKRGRGRAGSVDSAGSLLAPSEGELDDDAADDAAFWTAAGYNWDAMCGPLCVRKLRLVEGLGALPTEMATLMLQNAKTTILPILVESDDDAKAVDALGKLMLESGHLAAVRRMRLFNLLVDMELPTMQLGVFSRFLRSVLARTDGGRDWIVRHQAGVSLTRTLAALREVGVAESIVAAIARCKARVTMPHPTAPHRGRVYTIMGRVADFFQQFGKAATESGIPSGASGLALAHTAFRRSLTDLCKTEDDEVSALTLGGRARVHGHEASDQAMLQSMKNSTALSAMGAATTGHALARTRGSRAVAARYLQLGIAPHVRGLFMTDIGDADAALLLNIGATTGIGVGAASTEERRCIDGMVSLHLRLAGIVERYAAANTRRGRALRLPKTVDDVRGLWDVARVLPDDAEAELPIVMLRQDANALRCHIDVHRDTGDFVPVFERAMHVAWTRESATRGTLRVTGAPMRMNGDHVMQQLNNMPQGPNRKRIQGEDAVELDAHGVPVKPNGMTIRKGTAVQKAGLRVDYVRDDCSPSGTVDITATILAPARAPSDGDAPTLADITEDDWRKALRGTVEYTEHNAPQPVRDAVGHILQLSFNLRAMYLTLCAIATLNAHRDTVLETLESKAAAATLRRDYIQWLVGAANGRAQLIPADGRVLTEAEQLAIRTAADARFGDAALNNIFAPTREAVERLQREIEATLSELKLLKSQTAVDLYRSRIAALVRTMSTSTPRMCRPLAEIEAAEADGSLFPLGSLRSLIEGTVRGPAETAIGEAREMARAARDRKAAARKAAATEAAAETAALKDTLSLVDSRAAEIKSRVGAAIAAAAPAADGADSDVDSLLGDSDGDGEDEMRAESGSASPRRRSKATGKTSGGGGGASSVAVAPAASAAPAAPAPLPSKASLSKEMLAVVENARAQRRLQKQIAAAAEAKRAARRRTGSKGKGKAGEASKPTLSREEREARRLERIAARTAASNRYRFGDIDIGMGGGGGAGAGAGGGAGKPSLTFTITWSPSAAAADAEDDEEEDDEEEDDAEEDGEDDQEDDQEDIMT